jgi:MOSC domain-containing protein YiiM
MTARVTEVCVVHEVIDGYWRRTAIDKRPVSGPVQVNIDGPAGDTHMDPSHGGVDAAVYVYAEEDAACFAELLGHEIPAGWFGENLRVQGLDVTGALLGERWLVGDAETGTLLEVRKPRTPCRNLSQRVGDEGFHLDFMRSGRVGAMCRVLTVGKVEAGDSITTVHRPSHEVSVGVLVAGMSGSQAAELLASDAALAPGIRAKARRRVERDR